MWSLSSGVDESLLKALSEGTGGSFFKVETSSDLKAVSQEIDQLEKAIVELPEYEKGRDRFTVWAFFALLTLMIEFTLAATWLRKSP